MDERYAHCLNDRPKRLLCMYSLVSACSFVRAAIACDIAAPVTLPAGATEHGDIDDLASACSSSLLQASPTRRALGSAIPQPEDAAQRGGPFQADVPLPGPINPDDIQGSDSRTPPPSSSSSSGYQTKPAREAVVVTVIQEEAAPLTVNSHGAIAKFLTKTSQELKNIKWWEQGVTVPLSPVAIMAIGSALLGLASGVMLTRLCLSRDADTTLPQHVASAEVLQQWVSPSSSNALKTYVRFHNGPVPLATGDAALHTLRHTYDSSIPSSSGWKEAKPPAPPPQSADETVAPCDTQLALRDVSADESPREP